MAKTTLESVERTEAFWQRGIAQYNKMIERLNVMLTEIYGEDIHKYATIALAESATGFSDNNIIYVVETETFYRYESNGSAYTDDDTFVLSTADGGDTRWLGIAGKYINNSIILSNGGAISWVESNILDINVDNTKFDISEIKIGFIDKSDPNPDNHIKVMKTFSAQTGVIATYLTSNVGTWIGYQEDGTLVQSPTEFTPEQRNTIKQIGRLGHFGKTVITGVFDLVWIEETTSDWTIEQASRGTQLLFGAELSANGANLKVDRSIGNFLRIGGGLTRNAINFPQSPTGTQISFIPAWNSATNEGILGSATTDIDPLHYDDRSGTLQDIGAGKYANIFILHFPYKSIVTTFHIYGNKEYDTLASAEQGALNKEYSIPSDITGGSIIASISVLKETIDLTSAIAGGTATIKPSVQAGGGGGSVITYWDKIGTDLSPATPGDNIKLTGNIQLDDAVIEHENETHEPVYLTGQTGLNDLTLSGTYSLDGNATFQIRIDGVGSPNTFEWRKDAGAWTSDVPMSLTPVLLQDGIYHEWGSLTGHTNNDEWAGNVGHEIHISEPVHMGGDLWVDKNITFAGTMNSYSPVKIQEAIAILCDKPTDRARFETTCGAMDFEVMDSDILALESDGTIVARTTNYEDLVTEDNDIPNKKYIDDGLEQMSVALGTHIIENPADTDIIAKDSGDPTKIITIASFKLRTVTATNGIASIESIVLVPAGVEVTNTIPAFTGGWLGVRETAGTYEFFSKDKRDDFDLATECPIGRADRTITDISAIVSLPELGFGYAQDLYDIIAVTGLSKHISGGDLQTIAGGLALKRLEGRWWRTFANRDENQRHKMTNDAHNPITAYEIHSAYGDVEIPTEMEVGFIDDGAGGKTAIGAEEWSYYLCYHWARHTGVGFEGYQRSTRSFVSLHEARALRGQGIPEMHPALDAAVLTHIIYIKGDATDLNNPEQCSIEWVRKDNISSSGDPMVGELQQSGVIDWDGTEILTINTDSTKFDRGEFRIGFVDRETGVKFVRTVPSAMAQTVTNLTVNPFTFYGYNITTDSFIQQATPMNRTALNNIIPIGLIWHRNKTIIDLAQTMPLVVETSHDYAGQLLAFGALKQSGLNLSANGANKKVNLSTGVLEILGGTSTSRENISNAQPNSEIPLNFTPVHRAVTTEKVIFESVTDAPDYDVFDDGSGTLQELSPNNFGIHYFYIFAFRTTVDVFLIRGDESYATLDDAQTGLQQNPIPIPSDFKNGFSFSAVIAKKGTANLQTAITAGDAVITPADRFGSFGAGGSGGGGISSVVEDTTPQLGGNLDVLDKTIFSSMSDSIIFDIDKLNIYSNNVSDIGISIWNSQGSSSGAGAKLSLTSTDTSGGDPFIHFNIANVVSDWVLGIDNSDEDKMKFGASSILGTSTAMTIQRDGNVGIGSTNPDNGKLVVAIPGDTNATLIAFDEGFGGGGANNFKLIGNFDALGIANTLLLRDFNNNIDMAWTAGGNVGIGTDTPESMFHIKGNTPGTIGDNPAGQLIIQSPGTSDNSNAVIVGYASDAQGDPATQLWYMGSSSSSNADLILLNRMNSKLHLGTNGSAKMTIEAGGNVIHNNYTKLGSDAPAIKMKKLTGTTASTEGGIANIAHGLTSSKILSVDVRIEYGTELYVAENHNNSSGYEASKQWGSTNISIYNRSANSINILSKPLTLLVTYEE